MRQITLKKPVASVSSLRGSARVVFAATFACFMSAASLPAQGSTNVFNDAVFWFRGGKDRNGDHYMQQGEFFDDLNANDATLDNHKMPITGYTGSYVGFKENAAFANEQVIFPSLGTSIVKEMQVLHISNASKRQSNVYYYYPFRVDPRNVFANNNISKEYTIVSRIKMDEDGENRDECLFRIGYNASAKKGMYIALAKTPKSAGVTDIGSRYIKGKCTPDSESGDTSFNFPIRMPTNTWVDVAVVVGNGRLRVGIATPESSANHGNNSTIAFAETPMWTDNCELLEDGYRLFCFSGHAAPVETNNVDKTYFLGSVQQLAIWGRTLTDQEVMDAFGMPRPAIFRTGFDNGSSSEFGGTRSDATQTIDGLGSWQGIWNTMKAGDTWTVNFNALRDEAGLPQIFSIKSLPESAIAMIEPILNDTSLGVMRIAKNGRAFWPVPKDLIAAGENTLVIERKNSGSSDFKMDSMELGGSLGVGKLTYSSTDDGRVDPEYIKTGVPSAADPNPQHWPTKLDPSTGNNLHFRVWVDPDVADKASFTFRTAISNDVASGEAFSVYVNNKKKIDVNAKAEWKEYQFNPGVLNGGWNDFSFRTSTSCLSEFACFHFETVLPSAFSFPTPPGLSIVIR